MFNIAECYKVIQLHNLSNSFETVFSMDWFWPSKRKLIANFSFFCILITVTVLYFYLCLILILFYFIKIV